MNILISCDDNYLRPSIVDEKKRFGDFEIDTMIGKNRRGAIMTTNDRCTHLVLIRRLAGKEATQLASTAIEAHTTPGSVAQTRTRTG